MYPEERASFESWIGNNYQALNTSTYFPRLTPAQRVTLSQARTRAANRALPATRRRGSTVSNYAVANWSSPPTLPPRAPPLLPPTRAQKFTRPITDGIFANGGSFPVADADALPSLPGVPAFFAPFLQRAPYFQTEVNDRFMMNNMNISSRAKTLLEVVQHKETASEGFIGYVSLLPQKPRR